MPKRVKVIKDTILSNNRSLLGIYHILVDDKWMIGGWHVTAFLKKKIMIYSKNI